MCPHCSGSINCMADAGRCAASTARRLTSGRQEANAESDNADDAHPCVISAVGKADFFGVRLLSWLHAAPPLEEDPNAGDQRNRVDLSAYIPGKVGGVEEIALRSEEHTSELQSLMRISYAVFCLKKKKTHTKIHT